MDRITYAHTYARIHIGTLTTLPTDNEDIYFLFRSVSQNINRYIGIDIQRNGTEQIFFRMHIPPKLLPVEQK